MMACVHVQQKGVYEHLHCRERDANHSSRSHSLRIHVPTRPVELARLLCRRSCVRIFVRSPSYEMR